MRDDEEKSQAVSQRHWFCECHCVSILCTAFNQSSMGSDSAMVPSRLKYTGSSPSSRFHSRALAQSRVKELQIASLETQLSVAKQGDSSEHLWKLCSLCLHTNMSQIPEGSKFQDVHVGVVQLRQLRAEVLQLTACLICLRADLLRISVFVGGLGYWKTATSQGSCVNHDGVQLWQRRMRSEQFSADCLLM